MQSFEYLSPRSLKAALDAIGKKGSKYQLLAGGTNVVPEFREGTRRPALVVDLGRIKTLNYIRDKNGKISIGSMTTMADIIRSPIIKKHAPVLWNAASRFAGPVVRNRATIGGNLADASPAADSAVPLLALQARVRIKSRKAQRTVALEDFFTGYRKNVLRRGEILTEVVFPKPPRRIKPLYHKLGRRNAMAISVASVAIMLDMRGKTCMDATIALGAVAPTPIRAGKAEAVLKGKKVDVPLIRKCGEAAAKCTCPIDDIRASAEYRRTVCEVMVNRLICEGLGFENAFSNMNREE